MRSHKIEAFENLVAAFEAMPGVGHKSAVRLAYHSVTDEKYQALKLAHAIEEAVGRIRTCVRCRNMSEDELCGICADTSRDTTKLCIVQSAKDILLIEQSGRYEGIYYVITTLEDIDEVHLKQAVEGVSEVIFAFPPSIATDTMILYIEEKLNDANVTFTKIAQGVPTGVSLENVDVLSLSKALEARVKV